MSGNIYFSLFGGHIYSVQDDEVSVIDAFQIPLRKKPSSSCNECYGRFYIGYDLTKRHFIICKKCAMKTIEPRKLLAKKSGN